MFDHDNISTFFRVFSSALARAFRRLSRFNERLVESAVESSKIRISVIGYSANARSLAVTCQSRSFRLEGEDAIVSIVFSRIRVRSEYLCCRISPFVHALRDGPPKILRLLPVPIFSPSARSRGGNAVEQSEKTITRALFPARAHAR